MHISISNWGHYRKTKYRKESELLHAASERVVDCVIADFADLFAGVVTEVLGETGHAVGTVLLGNHVVGVVG